MMKLSEAKPQSEVIKLREKLRKALRKGLNDSDKFFKELADAGENRNTLYDLAKAIGDFEREYYSIFSKAIR